MGLGAAALVYAAVTALLFRNLLPDVTTHLYSDLGDPLLNTSILAWNATHLPLTGEWWNFPGFAPLSGVTSFTEHLLLTYPVASPVIWLTGNPVLAYNVVFLLAMPLNGMAAFALARDLLVRSVRLQPDQGDASHANAASAAAFIAGLAVAFAPYQSTRVSHLQTLLQFGMPLGLLGLHRYLDGGGRRALVLFGAGWLTAILANAYILAFFPILIVLWCIWFIRPREWRRLVPIAVTAAAATLPLLPIAFGYRLWQSTYGLARVYGEARTYAADIAGLAGISHRELLWHGWLPATYEEGALFPGLTIAALAILAVATANQIRSKRRSTWSRRLLVLALLLIGLVLARVWTGPDGWRVGPALLPAFRPFRVFTFAAIALVVSGLTSARFRAAWQSRSMTAFYAAAGAALWLIALGPEPAWLGARALTYGPYRLLWAVYANASVRVPARIWMQVVVCLAVLAGVGAAVLMRRYAPRSRLVPTVLAVLIVAEGWFADVGMRAPDPITPGLIPADALVLELPFDDVVSHTRAQYRAVLGGYRTVNGYSGYQPPGYSAVMDEMVRKRDGALDRYRRLSDLYVILPSGMDQPTIRWIAEQPGAVRISSGSAWQLYRLPEVK